MLSAPHWLSHKGNWVTLKAEAINVLQMKLDEIQCTTRFHWTQGQDFYSTLVVFQLEECKGLSVVQPWVFAIMFMWKSSHVWFTVLCSRAVNLSWDWLTYREAIETNQAMSDLNYVSKKRLYACNIRDGEQNSKLEWLSVMSLPKICPQYHSRDRVVPMNGCVNGFCPCSSCVNRSVKAGWLLFDFLQKFYHSRNWIGFTGFGLEMKHFCHWTFMDIFHALH